MKDSVVILTALQVEKAAVERCLKGETKIEKHPITGTDYTVGFINTQRGKVKIIVGLTDQTNVNSAIETERVINHYSPTYIFFVGVAGGLKDVSVGDIVIGSDVYGFERGKAEGEVFKPRPQTGSSSYWLERAAITFSESTTWNEIASNLLDTNFAPEIKVLKGTIAAGEKVDASIYSSLHKFLQQNASHALAIEMEGLGFLRTCFAYPGIKTLLLRGISDMVEGKSIMDSQGSQSYASQNVAEFVFGLINSIDFLEADNSNNISNNNQSLSNELFAVLCQLYPKGLEDKGIWSRAGGDLSFVNPFVPAKTQWVEALTLIQNGCGVEYKDLLKVLEEDFSKNLTVQELVKQYCN